MPGDFVEAFQKAGLKKEVEDFEQKVLEEKRLEEEKLRETQANLKDKQEEEADQEESFGSILFEFMGYPDFHLTESRMKELCGNELPKWKFLLRALVTDPYRIKDLKLAMAAMEDLLMIPEAMKSKINLGFYKDNWTSLAQELADSKLDCNPIAFSYLLATAKTIKMVPYDVFFDAKKNGANSLGSHMVFTSKRLQAFDSNIWEICMSKAVMETNANQIIDRMKKACDAVMEEGRQSDGSSQEPAN
jgi:hypothetical protein